MTAATIVFAGVAFARPGDPPVGTPKAGEAETWTFVDKGAPPERLFVFPSERPFGRLFFRDWNATDWADWRAAGAARGGVRVPAGQVVRLDLLPRASSDLSPLGSLPRGLVALNMGGLPIQDAQYEFLAGLTDLRILNARRTDIGDKGLAKLRELRALETLYLDDTQVTDAGLEALEGMTRLAHLSLSTSAGSAAPARIGDAGAARLAGLRALQFLDLSGAAVGDEGVKAFSGMNLLYHLALSRTNVGDEGVKTLAATGRYQRLHLHSTKVGDEGIRALAGYQLEELDVSKTRITPEGVKALAALPRLASLNVALNAAVGAESIEALRALPALQVLAVDESQFTPDQLLKIIEDRPKLKIKLVKLVDRSS